MSARHKLLSSSRSTTLPPVQLVKSTNIIGTGEVKESTSDFDRSAFLIELARHAADDRFMPFPDFYRKTTTPGTMYTPEEFKALKEDLSDLKNNPKLKEFITTSPLDLTLHNSGSIHPSIKEYEFRYPHADTIAKNIKYPNRWYLFHGSKVGNWFSILRNGIKNMSGTNFMTTGQACGPGVYLSDTMQIAGGYGGSGKYTYVAIVELLDDPAKYKKAEGYFVVPDDSLLFPRYLWVLEYKYDFPASTEMLEYYKKQRMPLIKNNTKLARLNSDLTKLTPEQCDSTDLNVLIFKIPDIKLYVYIFSYPFQSPILQLCNVLNKPNENFDDRGIFCRTNLLDWSAKKSLLDIYNLMYSLLTGYTSTEATYEKLV